jgi:hypothetical protein
VNVTPEQFQAALQRIEALEQQVKALLLWTHQAKQDTQAIRRAVVAWPGPFTAKDIHELVTRGGLQMDYANLHNRLQHLVKRGALEVVVQGAGPKPTEYEYTGTDSGVGRRGKHCRNTSGLICALRGALEVLPDPFRQSDVRDWMKEHWKGRPVAHLYQYIRALVDCGELEIVTRQDKQGGQAQTYRRKRLVSAATGQDLTPGEIAWREFSKNFSRPHPMTWDDASGGSLREMKREAKEV